MKTVSFLFVLFVCFVGKLPAATVNFDIPAQPAPAAFDLFIKQSGAQVVYIHNDVKDVRTNAVAGDYQPAAALDLLLKDTGLSSTEMKGGQFTVGRLKPGSVDGSVRDEAGKPVAGAKVSLADSDHAVLTDKRGRFSIAGVTAGAHALQITAEGLQNTRVTDIVVKSGQQHTLSPITIPIKKEGTLQLDDFVVSAKKNDGVIELDPYSVDGRRVKPYSGSNVDIQRSSNDAQPYYIFSAKTIDQSGATNIEDFLKQRLTMNTNALSNSQFSADPSTSSANGPLGNTSQFDLRGIGTDKTLVLVNGRRVAGIKYDRGSAADYQADLNGIPLASIERVEVLPSSASGIYGGGAIGGVINVVLKKDYVGGELRVKYENVWDTDAPNRELSLTYGQALEGGRTNLSLTISLADTAPMLLQDRRKLFERNLAVQRANSPIYFFSDTTPWLGSLPNIANSATLLFPVPAGTPGSIANQPVGTFIPGTTAAPNTPENPNFLRKQIPLVLKDGRALPSVRTYVPAGTSPSTPIATLANGLVANAGQWNFDLPPTAQVPTGIYRTFGSPGQTESVRLSLNRKFTDWLELFWDLAVSKNSTSGYFNPFNGDFSVPATSPVNPFTTAVRIRYPDRTQYPVETEAETRAAAFGGTFDLPGQWRGGFDCTFTENRFDSTYYSTDFSYSTDLAAGLINPFVDALEYSMDLTKYVYATKFNGRNQLHDLSLRASGPLYRLPWGTPTLTTSVQARRLHTPARTNDLRYPITTQNNLLTKYYERNSDTLSGYAELAIPLLKENLARGLHSLELQLAERSERYVVDTGTPSEQVRYNVQPLVTTYNSPTLDGLPFFAKTGYASHNHTIAIKYEPTKDIVIRASRATAFLPPTPGQLLKNPVPNPNPTTVLDPIFGSTQVQTISGGNPDLKPQNSESTNVGIIWQPSARALKGLRFNAEYYFIEQFDAIGNLTAQNFVDLETAYPGRVVRDASGRVTFIDTSSVNLYHRETQGWDFTADYHTATSVGEFQFNAGASLIKSIKTQNSLTLPELEAAGYHPQEGGTPKLKGNVAIVWQRREISAGLTARYFDSYKMIGAAGGPRSVTSRGGLEDPAWISQQGSNTIPSQAYFDVFVGYAFSSKGETAAGWGKLASGMAVQFGVKNVFNKVPPLDIPYRESNLFLSPYGDARLRTYWVSVKKFF